MTTDKYIDIRNAKMYLPTSQREKRDKEFVRTHIKKVKKKKKAT